MIFSAVMRFVIGPASPLNESQFTEVLLFVSFAALWGMSRNRKHDVTSPEKTAGKGDNKRSMVEEFTQAAETFNLNSRCSLLRYTLTLRESIRNILWNGLEKKEKSMKQALFERF